MKESFVIYKGFYAPIKELSNEDLGQLFRWLFEYQINGIEPTNTDRVFMAFQFFKNQFRLDEQKYDKVVNRNRNNGLKGGRKQTQHNPNNPVGFLEPKKADKDNEKDKDKDINNTCFSFDEFWSIYPNKVAKSKCKDKYKKISESDRLKIKETLNTFINHKPFESYVHPHPETYINQRRWEDEIAVKPHHKHEQQIIQPQYKKI